MKWTLFCALIAVGLMAGTVVAGWDEAGSYSAGGSDSAEVRLRGGSVSEIRFTCTQGSVTIKSVVVTTPQGEATVDVNERMSEGDTKEVSLRYHLCISAIKVNHEGSGRYQVDLQ